MNTESQNQMGLTAFSNREEKVFSHAANGVSLQVNRAWQIVPLYKTTDGQVFDDNLDAKMHQKLLDMQLGETLANNVQAALKAVKAAK